MTRPVEEYGDIAEMMDEYMAITWDPTVARDDDPSGGTAFNRHLLVEWNGGMLWLELQDLTKAPGAGDLFPPHFAVDVRWLRDGLVVDQGLYVLHQGQRFTLQEVMGGIRPPQGSHGWPGGETITVVVDAPPLDEAEFADQVDVPHGPA